VLKQDLAEKMQIMK